MKNMRKNVATPIPTPTQILSIEPDKKLPENTHSQRLLSICNKLAKILYSKEFKEVLRTEQTISQETKELNENNKYIIIIPKNTGKKETNLNLLCNIKSMVQHANKKGISMTIREIK